MFATSIWPSDNSDLYGHLLNRSIENTNVREVQQVYTWFYNFKTMCYKNIVSSLCVQKFSENPKNQNWGLPHSLPSDQSKYLFLSETCLI